MVQKYKNSQIKELEKRYFQLFGKEMVNITEIQKKLGLGRTIVKRMLDGYSYIDSNSHYYSVGDVASAVYYSQVRKNMEVYKNIPRDKFKIGA